MASIRVSLVSYGHIPLHVNQCNCKTGLLSIHHSPPLSLFFRSNVISSIFEFWNTLQTEAKPQKSWIMIRVVTFLFQRHISNSVHCTGREEAVLGVCRKRRRRRWRRRRLIWEKERSAGGAALLLLLVHSSPCSGGKRLPLRNAGTCPRLLRCPIEQIIVNWLVCY